MQMIADRGTMETPVQSESTAWPQSVLHGNPDPGELKSTETILQADLLQCEADFATPLDKEAQRNNGQRKSDPRVKPWAVSAGGRRFSTNASRRGLDATFLQRRGKVQFAVVPNGTLRDYICS